MCKNKLFLVVCLFIKGDYVVTKIDIDVKAIGSKYICSNFTSTEGYNITTSILNAIYNYTPSQKIKEQDCLIQCYFKVKLNKAVLCVKKGDVVLLSGSSDFSQEHTSSIDQGAYGCLWQSVWYKVQSFIVPGMYGVFSLACKANEQLCLEEEAKKNGDTEKSLDYSMARHGMLARYYELKYEVLSIKDKEHLALSKKHLVQHVQLKTRKAEIEWDILNPLFFRIEEQSGMLKYCSAIRLRGDRSHRLLFLSQINNFVIFNEILQNSIVLYMNMLELESTYKAKTIDIYTNELNKLGEVEKENKSLVDKFNMLLYVSKKHEQIFEKFDKRYALYWQGKSQEYLNNIKRLEKELLYWEKHIKSLKKMITAII